MTLWFFWIRHFLYFLFADVDVNIASMSALLETVASKHVDRCFIFHYTYLHIYPENTALCVVYL